MKSALITGCTGFIGGKLAEHLLASGWRVDAVLRSSSNAHGLVGGLNLHRHDGTIEELSAILAATRPDIVFHLASLYLADHRADQVDALVGSNILFTAQLAEAMTGAGTARLVNTGTAWQHFGTDGYNPVNLYAATKQAAVDLLRYYHDARGLSVVTLKLFDTYGVGDKRRKLVQLLVDAARSAEPLGMSPGEQIVDLTHVDDVVAAFMNAADLCLAAPEPLLAEYFVSGERFTVQDLASSVEDALARPIEADFGALPYRPREVMVPVQPPPEQCLPGWRRASDLRSFVSGSAQP